MPEPIRTYVHVLTTDLDKSLDLLRNLSGSEPDVVLDAGGGIRTALISQFMVITAPKEVLDSIREASGSVIVEDLDRVEDELRRAGAEFTLPRQPSPLGEFLYARHPDGTMFEYATIVPEKLAAAQAAGQLGLTGSA